MAALLCLHSRPVQAQTAGNGDGLEWDGGAGVDSWTDTSNTWYDITKSTAVSLSPASGNQGQTYGFFFENPATAPTAGTSTATPTNMIVGTDSDPSGQLFGVNSMNFAAGFNSTDTTTISSYRTTDLANSLNFTSDWAINDTAADGTVTFNPTSGSQSFGGLYFTLSGGGEVSVNGGASVVLNVALSDGSTTGSIAKIGGGTLTLAPTSDIGNNYTGGTTVTGGTLIVSGTNAPSGTGAVTVSNAGSVLAGSGTIIGATTINSGATLSPGSSPGAIAKLGFSSTSVTGGLTINGNYQIDINGGGAVAGVNYDQIEVSGLLTLNPTSSHLVFGTVNPTGMSVGQVFYIVVDSGNLPIIGTFEGEANGATIKDSEGDTYMISYLANGDGGTVPNDISLTVESVVPEPAAGWVLGLGAAGLLASGLRRRYRANEA